MRNRKDRLVLFLTAFLCVASVTARAGQPVSMESLLTQMVNRETVARFPEPDFRLRQQSSYDRLSKTPDDPTGWFANKDHTKNFVRVEENSGRKEWVLMDHEGPGAIVRIWMPFRGAPKNDVRICFYLDGASEPALEGNIYTLLNGDGLIPYPLAHKSLLSAVSFFPIPYAKSCKVTMTEQPFFFQFTYREYADGATVKTFTRKDFDAAASRIRDTGTTLLNPHNVQNKNKADFATRLAAKEEKAIELPDGPAAVRTLSVKLGNDDTPSDTRSVVLKMAFDGNKTVWCPVGDFFGTGIGLHPFQGWYRTVADDGTMSCRWVMPYRNTGKVSVVNLSDHQVDVRLEAVVGDWQWDQRSMYFHAGWRGQYPVPTRPFSDWNYITLEGRGVYVGDTLTVMNPVEKWWGEGDEKIWIDGEDFPSIFGTGTEDYYGYSWGGVSTDFYEHPFHSQPRCHVYDKRHRKTTNERNTFGYSTETRTRSLDTIPFGRSLQHDLEVWSWTDCNMAYAVATYWYGDAETTSNRQPDPAGALAVPPLPENAAAKPAASRFENAVECEEVKITAKSQKITAQPQPLQRFRNHRWSGASHLFARGGTIGDFVELRFPSTEPKPARLVLHATCSYDYGIVRFTVNGQPAGAEVDLYAEKPIPSGAIELGVFEPMNGSFVLRAEIAGKNAKSAGTYFGLDCMVITPRKSGAQRLPEKARRPIALITPQANMTSASRILTSRRDKATCSFSSETRKLSSSGWTKMWIAGVGDVLRTFR